MSLQSTEDIRHTRWVRRDNEFGGFSEGNEDEALARMIDDFEERIAALEARVAELEQRS